MAQNKTYVMRGINGNPEDLWVSEQSDANHPDILAELPAHLIGKAFKMVDGEPELDVAAETARLQDEADKAAAKGAKKARRAQNIADIKKHQTDPLQNVPQMREAIRRLSAYILNED